MTLFSKTLVALTAGLVMMSSAQAVNKTDISPYYADNETGTPYVGLKGGSYLANGDGADGLDNSSAYGVYGGYHFDRNFSAEVEYMDSNKGDYDAKTFGAYGAYRHYFNADNNLYAKGKLGFASTEVNENDNDNELAGGIGIGYDAGSKFGLEAEYSRVYNDNDYEVSLDTITFGARLKF